LQHILKYCFVTAENRKRIAIIVLNKSLKTMLKSYFARALLSWSDDRVCPRSLLISCFVNSAPRNDARFSVPFL